MRWLAVAALVALMAGGTGLTTDQAMTRAAAQDGSDDMDRPNVLIIMTDDQRLQDTMEHMPKTARWFGTGGTHFPNAFSAAAICCPVRAGVWTGQYVHNHGVLTTAHANQIDEDATIQRYLHDAGYKTAAFGKFFNSYALSRTPAHFDEWAFHQSGYTNVRFNHNGEQVTIDFSPTFIKGEAMDYLQRTEADDDQPWYLYLTPYAPHSPWIPEEKYANTLFPPWLGNPATHEVDRSDKPQHMQGTVPGASGLAGVPFEHGPEAFTTLGEVGTNLPVDRQTYLRTLLTIDDMVDEIMTQLAAQDELDDTIAIFTSDQGYLWGEHGWYNKMVPYTAGIQVPFYVRWPSGHVPPHGVEDRIVSGVDILPTILDVTGLEADPAKNHDGYSILDTQHDRAYILTEYNFQNLPLTNPVPTWASLRSDTWQYIEYYNNTGGVTFAEFYDLENDPWQLDNQLAATKALAPMDAAVVTDLHALLADARACRGTTGPTACP